MPQEPGVPAQVPSTHSHQQQSRREPCKGLGGGAFSLLPSSREGGTPRSRPPGAFSVSSLQVSQLLRLSLSLSSEAIPLPPSLPLLCLSLHVCLQLQTPIPLVFISIMPSASGASALVSQPVSGRCTRCRVHNSGHEPELPGALSQATACRDNRHSGHDDIARHWSKQWSYSPKGHGSRTESVLGSQFSRPSLFLTVG